MSKYIANIPDFSSISEQHSFQVYNMSLNLVRNESDPMKFANQLSLASTNLLLYYDLLETNKLISQAALVSIAINKAIFYVTGKFDDKYNLNASDKTKQITRITQAKNPSLKSEIAKFGGSRQDKGSSGSEELLFLTKFYSQVYHHHGYFQKYLTLI
ncbi:uncharacterized protein CEXT_121501 [Caerostris extrusa]|uniref:Uncharacterized protein n=1 Tax=Caerostris extrusa TaxID=172846 RepID=A0AAV4RLQ6_CAEEX|nr:uncharacterized protein CEXT_121501 [Caerostris extrusa]